LGPWDQGGPWSPTGIGGVARFLNRVWTVVLDPHGSDAGSGALPVSDPVAAAAELRITVHRTVRDVTADYESFHFNTMVAKLMELTNRLMRFRGTAIAGGDAWDEAVRLLLLMLAPAAPHITEELWSRRLAAAGEAWRSIHRESWPTWEAALVAEQTVELPVQVDGKVRDRLTVPAGLPAADVERLALASPKVQAALGGKAPAKVIHVPGRLVNLVGRAP